MGKAVALVRCKSDGQIYIGRYNGISNTLDGYLERIEDFTDYSELINKIENKPWPMPPFEEEPCEIYSEYGSGFYWEGTFDRNKHHVIKGSSLDTIDVIYFNIQIYRQIPDWAKKKLENL